MKNGKKLENQKIQNLHSPKSSESGKLSELSSHTQVLSLEFESIESKNKTQ